jgi:hypothetical protein
MTALSAPNNKLQPWSRGHDSILVAWKQQTSVVPLPQGIALSIDPMTDSCTDASLRLESYGPICPRMPGIVSTAMHPK